MWWQHGSDSEAEAAGWRPAEQAVPHSHVADKNWEGHLGREPPQPQDRPQSPGFQHRKNEAS